MASLIKATPSGFRCVYSDELLPLLLALGSVTVRRASEVEWDHATQEWFAIYLPTGEEIARGRNRQQVIAAEVAWLEARL